MSGDKGALLWEGLQRGILPPDKAALAQEAHKRGLLGSGPAPIGKPTETPKAGIGESLWEGLKRGARDVVESGAEIGSKMGSEFPGDVQPGQLTPQVNQAVQQGAQAYQQTPAVQQHPLAAGIGRVGGNIAASAPLAAVPGASGAGMGLAGRAALGAGMGAATGGLPGAAAGGLTGGLGGMIGPRINPAFQAIAQEVPNFTQMVSGVMPRTPDSFQRAVANEVLKPIGQTIERSVKAGHDLVNAVGDKLEDAYNAVLPKVTFRAVEKDPETGTSFAEAAKALEDQVPESFLKDFGRLYKRVITDRLDENGNMTGQAFKKADSEIGKKAASNLAPRANATERDYGEALRELQMAMRENLAIHNPTESKALQDANTAWARYVRMEEAAGRGVSSNGEFMPNDLLASVKKLEGARGFSQGDKLMQKFGRAGNELIAGRPMNGQRWLADLVGAGIGGAAGHAMGGPVGGYLGAGAGAVGSDIGQRAFGGIARQTEKPGAREFGAAVGRSAGMAGTAGASTERDLEPYASVSGP
jgi:hypothetical protein